MFHLLDMDNIEKPDRALKELINRNKYKTNIWATISLYLPVIPDNMGHQNKVDQCIPKILRFLTTVSHI